MEEQKDDLELNERERSLIEGNIIQLLEEKSPIPMYAEDLWGNIYVISEKERRLTYYIVNSRIQDVIEDMIEKGELIDLDAKEDFDFGVHRIQLSSKR